MQNLITIKFYTKPYLNFLLQRNGTCCLNKHHKQIKQIKQLSK